MSLPSGSGTEVGREGLYRARQHEGSSVVGILQVHCQNQKSPVQTGTSNLTLAPYPKDRGQYPHLHSRLCSFQ